MSCIAGERPTSGMASPPSSPTSTPLGSARLGQRAADDRGQLLQVERLRQVFVGALLRGADRRHEGVLRAHHHDRQVRPRALDARNQVEGVAVRHDHVGDDDIALAFRHPAPERRRVGGEAHRVAGARQRLVQHRADGGVVVGDEDRSGGHFAASEFLVRQPSGMRRHQDAKSRPPRLRLAFDDAAVVADDLGDQRKAEAGAVRLGGDEGIEEVGQHVFRARRGRCR